VPLQPVNPPADSSLSQNHDHWYQFFFEIDNMITGISSSLKLINGYLKLIDG